MKIAESILNTLAEPILLLDREFRAVVANPAFFRTFAIAPESLSGADPSALMTGESSRTRMMAALEALRYGHADVDRVEVKGANPPEVYSVRARRVQFHDNLPDMVLVEFRDITPERRRETHIQELNASLRRHTEELHRTNQELESFSHSASHDLRTPLRLTGGLAHMLLNEHGADLPPAAVEKVRLIIDTTEEMGNLIESLLALSRLSHVPLKLTAVDPARVAREALRSLREERQGRNVHISLDTLPSCRADRALLRQVYHNLISNALKFTRPRDRAEIQIGCENREGCSAYFVKDNGVGLDGGGAHRMFESFQRLRNARGFEGSGIGLSLVKRIVERHDGTIWAEGEEGRGASIYFTLGNDHAIERRVES